MTETASSDAESLTEPAVELVKVWLAEAAARETRSEAATMARLEGVVTDPDGVRFVMGFVDRVIRPDDERVATAQLASLVSDGSLPAFLSRLDRLLLRAGAVVGAAIPRVVMPLARRRMRSIVGHLVAPGEPDKLRDHLTKRRNDGYALNVNLLGEAVLGEREAARRLAEVLDLFDQPEVDYVSVKLSAVASQLNHWAYDDSVRRVIERLRTLVDRAAAVQPPTFLNIDMEEYHDLALTLDAFTTVLGEPLHRHVDAGIVLQAYLPDSYAALIRLTEWANARHADGGGQIKIRLVKGANLAMERVDAAMHGWEQAPYASKEDTDANFKRCVDWLLHDDRTTGVQLGLASHNLFDVAWTHLLATDRGVADRVQFEMLQGMAPALAATVSAHADAAMPLLLYTPAVRGSDFDVAIGYLFRRLEENASDANFMRHLFDLASDPPVFADQAERFRVAVRRRSEVDTAPRRRQDRGLPARAAYAPGEDFRNEPQTDPTAAANRRWIKDVYARRPDPVEASITSGVEEIDAVLADARAANARWKQTSPAQRRVVLHRVGDELSRRRAELVSTMMHEANKTFAEADVEVDEAVDFARWYGDRAAELDSHPTLTFDPLGTIAVVPPWNFPVAIPAGGVLAGLAAGNAVILKPAPETPRCAELVALACWAAGVPADVLHFVRTRDDDVGRHLVTSVDAVILTGSVETAALFRSWKPEVRLFAETSGKNAMIITPSADLDLAVADLVKSAFGHSGQKCSAASVAILVGEVARSPRFRRQLIDAVESIDVGPSTRIEPTMGPLIGEPNERLFRALTELDQGESWLVEPQRLSGGRVLWAPGVRDGVRPGSWFHRTECFGPVLGLVQADDLDEAIAIQNSSDFGLTGGIHTLDPHEIDAWTERVEVGNGYVNRATTGAIVQRQPFGGWKRSSVGPGAKAGGPNYVAQLGTWSAASGDGVDDDYAESWRTHFAIEHDPTGLFCEANVFRYRPIERVMMRTGAAAARADVALVTRAAGTAGVDLVESAAADETQIELAARLGTAGVARIRVLGETISTELRIAANASHVHLAEQPVVAVGRIELQHYVREQAMSRTMHRFGNLVGARAAVEQESRLR